MTIKIDQSLCKACGICGDVCPRHIMETMAQNDEKITVVSSERIELCMKCGHCVAVCPNNAIQVEDLNPEDFTFFEKLTINDDQILSLLRQRRSIRRYKDKPVPREIINRIIDAAQMAPTGTASISTGVIVIDDPQKLKEFSEHVYQLYEKLGKALESPIGRFFVKRRAGKMFKTLQDFVMPGMHWYIQWYREGKSNEILRDCPALMLFHSHVNEPMGAENCLIAAFHSIMMAEVQGIGTCFNDLIPPACNRAPEIGKMLGLPDDREVYAAITMGYSKYKFKRMPPRKLAEVRYL